MVTKFGSLIIAAVAHFFVDFMIGVLPVYKTMANLDLATTGLILAFCSLIGEGSQIIFGTMSDRGYRKALILGGAVATLVATALPYAQNNYLLLCFYLVVALGSGAFHPTAAGMVGELSHNRKGLFITIFASAGTIGMAASQLVFSKAYFLLDAQTLYLAIPPLLILGFFICRPFPSPSAKSSGPHIEIKQLFQFFRDRNLTLLYIIQMCISTIYWALIFFLPDILLSRGYDDWLVFGGGHMCSILGGGLAMIPSGYLADNYSAKSVLVCSTVIGAIAFYVFFLSMAISTPAAILLLVIIGAAFGVISPVILAFGNALEPTRPGMVSAFLMGSVWCISECLGPGGGGLLTKLFVHDAAGKAMILLGLLSIGAIAASFKLPHFAIQGQAESSE